MAMDLPPSMDSTPEDKDEERSAPEGSDSETQDIEEENSPHKKKTRKLLKKFDRGKDQTENPTAPIKIVLKTVVQNFLKYKEVPLVLLLRPVHQEREHNHCLQ